MRNIDETIRQAQELGSEERLMVHEIVKLRDMATDENGHVSLFNLTTAAYDYGFMLGYRMAKKESRTDVHNQSARQSYE